MRWLALLVSVYAGLAGAAPQVARRSHAGPDAVVGRLAVAAPMPAVVAALQAPCAVRQWLAGLDELRVVGHPAPNQTLIFTRQDLPWPWQDRAVVSRFTRHGRPRSDTVSIDQANVAADNVPLNGAVRIPWLRARWSLHRQNGKTHIRYRQRIKLGGAVPQWVTDRAATHLVRDSLQGLADYLAQPAGRACTNAGAAGK